MFGNYRHKLQVYIFIILVFIAFCTPTYWMQWAFLASISFLVLVTGYFYFFYLFIFKFSYLFFLKFRFVIFHGG